MVLLSGDQIGEGDSGGLAVSGRSLISKSPTRCTHTWSTLSDRAARNATIFPSGDTENVLRPRIRNPSGIGIRYAKNELALSLERLKISQSAAIDKTTTITAAEIERTAGRRTAPPPVSGPASAHPSASQLSASLKSAADCHRSCGSAARQWFTTRASIGDEVFNGGIGPPG